MGQQQQQQPRRNSRGQFVRESEQSQSRGQQRRRQNLQPLPQRTARSQRSCSSATASVFSLLAGAGVGVAMMYLFDPEEGEQRRMRLANRSRELLESSKDVAYDAAQSGSSAAQSIGSRIASAASHVAGLAGDYGSRAASQISSSGGDAYERAKEHMPTFAGLRESASDAKHRMNVALGRERKHHYAGQTACAVGSLALGAGLIWAFDPRLGRSRRAWLRDKSMHWLRETGDFFRYAGVHASNRVKGTVAETRGYFRRNEPVDDARLCARVRSELGRVIEDSHAVEVLAQDGHVTLRGTADGAQINSIANVVLGIRGVRGFDNQLRTPGTTAATTTQSSPV